MNRTNNKQIDGPEYINSEQKKELRAILKKQSKDVIEMFTWAYAIKFENNNPCPLDTSIEFMIANDYQEILDVCAVLHENKKKELNALLKNKG